MHPELVGNVRLGGTSVPKRIDRRCEELSAETDGIAWPDVTVVIRTLNERQPLEEVVSDFRAQDYPEGAIHYVVVDNGSTDGTQDVAREVGATVVDIPRGEFTHPKSLNIGLNAARDEFVVVVSGHIRLATDMFLKAGSSALLEGAVGAYTWPPLPSSNASLTERLGIGVMQHGVGSRVHDIRTARWGALCMAGSMIRRSAWESAGGFSERFETGGEDTDLAGRLISNGERIVFDPAMTIHHTHGLGLANRLRRTLHLGKIVVSGKGSRFDRERMQRGRPDLGLNE